MTPRTTANCSRSASASESPKHPSSAAFTIVEWNLHWGCHRVAGAPPGPYTRFDELAALDGWLDDADIVVLPEAWRPHDEVGVVDRLAAAGWTTFETPFVELDMRARPKVASPAGSGSGMWTLAVATRLPARLVRTIPLPRTRHDPVPRRHAIHAMVEVAGTEIDFVAYHVSSKLWYAAPPIQLLGLTRSVRGLGRGDRPAVLAGDANWWRSTLPLWLPGWRSTVRGATFPAHKPHSQIDHVLVRGGLRATGGDVAPANWGSDHRAIRTTLAVG